MHVFIFGKEKTLLSTDTLFVKKNAIYIMPDERGREIDSKADFKIVSYLLKNELFKKI